MKSLMTKIRPVLDRKRSLIVLDEYVTADKTGKHLEDIIKRASRLGGDNVAAGTFIVAPNPGIYQINLDKEEPLMSSEVERLIRFCADLQKQINFATTDLLKVYPDYLPQSLIQLRPNAGHNYEPSLILDMPTLKNTYVLADINISPGLVHKVDIKKPFRNLFPDKDFSSESSQPLNTVQLTFGLYLEVWLNKELYLLQKEEMNKEDVWARWLKERETVGVERRLIRNSSQFGLRSGYLYNDGGVNICSFNQYFKKHPPKKQ